MSVKIRHAVNINAKFKKKKKDTAFFLTFYTFNILFFCLKI